MSFKHLSIQDSDTTANLNSLATGGSLSAQQFYWDTTEQAFRYAIDSSTISDVIPGGNAAISNLADSNSIDFTDQGSGTWTADLTLDGASDNVLAITANGAYVQDIAIESGSQIYLGYNSSTRELSVKNLLISDTYVDTTSTSISDFVTNNYSAGTEYQEGDTIILTATSDPETYIHNGGSAGTTADFEKISVDSLTDSYVRGLFSGGDGISYNGSTGEISVDLSGDAGNDLSFGGDTGIYLDVNTSDVTDTEGHVVVAGNDTSLQSLLDYLAANISASNYSYDVTADSGTNQTINDGNTLSILGGDGISTTVGATDQVTVDVDTSTASTNDVLTYDGSVTSWVNRSSLYTFNNGVSESTGTVSLGGTLNSNTDLDLDGFTLALRNASNNDAVQFSDSGSVVNAIIGDMEVSTIGNGYIVPSPNGTRFRITVDDDGALVTSEVV